MSATIVRAYQFYNFVKDGMGRVFYLCDDHIKTQKIPEECSIEEIGISDKHPCQKCSEKKKP